MSIRLHLIVIIAFLCAGVCGGLSTARAAEDYGLSYSGAEGNLLDTLKILSTLEKQQRTYPTGAALRRAAERDTRAFADALQAAGYYAGKASFRFTPASETEPAQINFEIETGPAFTVTEYEILYKDEAPDRPGSFEDAKIETDGSAAGAALRDLQLRFLSHLWESGYPAAEIAARRAIANMDKATASAVFVFRSGPKAQFGEPVVDGAEKTNPKYIRTLKTWKVGDEYERSTMARYRDRLAATSLFSTIDISPGVPDETGVAPIYVNLEERKPRTIGAGVSVSTAEGVGGRLFFENRNLFGQGEALNIELRAANIEQSINFDIRKPLPKLPGQAFGNFEFSNETTDAFDARSVAVRGGLAKQWLNDRLETRGALGFETSNVKADGEEERNYFVSTPLSVVWNSENNLLNPTSGVQARFAVTPYTGTDTFTQTELSARSRITAGENNFFTLAGRAAAGATFGSSLDDLPRNKRFYVGGAGSVRGFGFQEAGPLDAENDPIGGRSYIEAAIEARFKVTDDIQIAAFADAGSVSAQNTPDFDEKFFVGVGGGVRYFTPIGPLRADVAFPLDPRESDRNFQIFIAIGQPF